MKKYVLTNSGLKETRGEIGDQIIVYKVGNKISIVSSELKDLLSFIERFNIDEIISGGEDFERILVKRIENEQNGTIENFVNPVSYIFQLNNISVSLDPLYLEQVFEDRLRVARVEENSPHGNFFVTSDNSENMKGLEYKLVYPKDTDLYYSNASGLNNKI